MPHLAPLNWLILPMFFFMSLLLISSIMWWSQLVMIPKLHSNTSSTSLLWKWT
uniref:ATP synthase F0 subunit 8 n=1 Tax=Sclerolinum brattstromi TaxID=167799 RepID=A0A0E3DR99_9ANNE|nr:ATP synthase F0 subunit 8 [Sclerolinum brattstromi]AIL54785.1 ATP synthase F0 subunit 8 [Sclerolinum brattstromi]